MNCPSCWRPISFEEKYTKILACGYCNSILELWRKELNKIWEQSEFIEFPSIFKVWKSTEWKNKEIYVKWQMRYEYDWGFFDRFFVLIDWKEFLIEEDDWLKKVLESGKWQKSSDTILDKPVWENVVIWWQEVFIQETWIFKLVNIKWFVNTDLIVWKDYEYLDWIVEWKKIIIEKELWSNRIKVLSEADILEDWK